MECINPHFRAAPPFSFDQLSVITLCGSTRFKDLFLEAARDLTL